MRALLAFGLLSLAASAGQAAIPVANVELSNFKFTPSTVQLHAGAPVVLHIANVGSGAHNFSAPAFFAAAKLDPQAAALVHDGKVEVRGHSAIDLPLVPAAGQYGLKCTHTLHSSFGMKGVILVR
jgi:uncharacterized cupredoxin-like copper-binding protein